ncbi:ABC-F family ATP-binding cassette domain-containing protein [uncultured Clostridium sp.]|uniref:ABC-F family ATP-binding cassette domain-containing protein n=1 Tax=uncultured Clostridium sp. TaxID=59620 RepID=UPI0028E9CA9A|nr:ABC-F family ATP-binding cassette domain-containing protein [uncultured Clostridium sp.]
MNLISIENLCKSYSEKELFKNINLGINDGDKIGVIGINGTGKTTLLKIIAGEESIDEGRIIKGNSVKIEYLSQNPYFEAEATVLEQVFRGNSPIMEVIREYEKAIENLDSSSEYIMELTSKMDASNAWGIESEAKAILMKLGISNFNAKVGSLSGGQRKRIALASALINPCELLILDEPTNHLDNETIDWLEEYLNKRKGALIMVTHDRYFLDRVVNKIAEIDRGNIYTYDGNYESFLEKKMEREEMEQSLEKKRQNILRKELSWIKRGAKARSTKQKARIDRFEKLSEEGIESLDKKVEISVAGSYLGKKVMELKNINKSFHDKKIIKDFNYIVTRNDRIGIVGPNGFGKSTLINIMSNRMKPDGGEVEVGETVKIGLFSQETNHMNEDLRVIEYIKEGGEIITTADGEKISASQMLERFLFTPSMQWTPISKLSGGEKRRLYLLRTLMEGPNVLLLDEPTNDLDIETLTILEDYIDNFQGAVIAVSHDRYFLDRVAEKIFLFEGEGNISQNTGNYSDLKEKINSKEIEKNINNNEEIRTAPKEKDSERRKNKPLKFSYKEQREYEEIDNIISQLEDKLQQLESDINNASTEYDKLQNLLTEKEEAENQLEEKMERWVYLNEIAEKIAEKKANDDMI